MQQNNEHLMPGWIRLLDRLGLVRAGLVVWMVGLAALSFKLDFHLLAWLSLAGAAALLAQTFWWKPTRGATRAAGGRSGPPTAE